MIEKLSTCCFTGHRRIEPVHKELLPALLRQQILALTAENVTTFVTGGARGFDTLAAETVLDMRATRLAIRLVVVAPCGDQSSRWAPDDIARYERIREQADEFICLFDAYTPRCMKVRNRTLVDMSSLCIAYCLRERSGSFSTMAYAGLRCLTVMNLADRLRQISI